MIEDSHCASVSTLTAWGNVTFPQRTVADNRGLGWNVGKVHVVWYHAVLPGITYMLTQAFQHQKAMEWPSCLLTLPGSQVFTYLFGVIVIHKVWNILYI